MPWKSFLAGVLTVIAIAVISGGAYYLGTQRTASDEIQTQEQSLKQETQTQTTTPKVTPTPTSVPTKTISAGGAVSFHSYTATVPSDWQVKHEPDEAADTDTLTLSKDGYEIRIFQAATGGALCLYPGDPDFEGPSGMYDSFQDIAGKDGVKFRRSGVAGYTGFTICQFQEDGSFFQPTLFGHTSLELPEAYDESILAEMDAIIASLQQQ